MSRVTCTLHCHITTSKATQRYIGQLVNLVRYNVLSLTSNRQSLTAYPVNVLTAYHRHEDTLTEDVYTKTRATDYQDFVIINYITRHLRTSPL